MKTLTRIFASMAIGVCCVTASVADDASFAIEQALMENENQDIQFSDLKKGVTNVRARYALEKAESSQTEGDYETRDRYMSLSLSLLDQESLNSFRVQQAESNAPKAAGSSPKSTKFERLYGEGGLLSEESRGVLDDAVDSAIDSEKWFISFMEKLGILSKNYKELNDKLREKYPHLSKDELADHLIRESARLTAGVGFATALPGMIPGVGTAAKVAVSVGSMVPDMIFLFKKQATLIFRIAEIYGKDLKEEERVTEALILFGVASGVSTATKALEKYMEEGFSVYIRTKISGEAIKSGVTKLAALNPIIGDILTTLFSKKFISEATMEKTALSVVPLIGAGLSGAMNYVFTKKVGQIAKTFYGDNSADRLEAMNNLQLPKVELAMFRALVKMITADGLKKEVEILTLNKFLAKFQHNRGLVERMLEGEQDLIDKLDYDISEESLEVKEQILYAVTVMAYVDLEKGPEEIELYDKIIEKFQIPEQDAKQVEIRVKKEKDFSGNVVKSFFGNLYHGYQKAIGAKEEMDF